MYKHTGDVTDTLNMVYSELGVDEELNTRVSILQMMYSIVQPLSKDVIYCEQDDNVTVVNRNGIEIASGTKDTLKILGIFLAIVDKNVRRVTIYCFSTQRQKKIDNIANYGFFDLKQAGPEFISLEIGSRVIILNKYLDTIFDVNTYKLKAYVNGESRVCIKYRIDLYRESTGYINRLTGAIESYDSFDLNETYRMLATDYHKSKGIAINKDCIHYFKYKLVKDNIIVSKKSYEDITKPSELTSTDTLYTFDLDDKYRASTKIGLIRRDGTELLEPIYDGIRYVGANNYIVDMIKNDVRYTAIYNSERGVLYNFGELISADMHRTLPFVVLFKVGGGVKLLTTDGNEIEPAELSKYFKCSYSEQRPDIIRLDLDYGKKYITNTLVPITNMHEITKMTAHNWIPM